MEISALEVMLSAPPMENECKLLPNVLVSVIDEMSHDEIIDMDTIEPGHRFKVKEELGEWIYIRTVVSTDTRNGVFWVKVRDKVSPSKKSPGYHLVDIEKHAYGTSGKVMEEVQEFMDAEKQGVKLMALQELSDIIGAIKGYLEKNHPTVTMEDLEAMAKVTKRAFESGARK
ncbi:hypothetical protein [Salmonella phage SSBI34]|nr:hypothetical protein [Salmonella phage SSBI34]